LRWDRLDPVRVEVCPVSLNATVLHAAALVCTCAGFLVFTVSRRLWLSAWLTEDFAKQFNDTVELKASYTLLDVH
jgi:hypothetical protein